MTIVAHTPTNTEALIVEWREQRKTDTDAPWPIMPAWVVDVEISITDPDETLVTLKGRTWSAGEFESRIEQTFVVYPGIDDDGDTYYTPAGPLVALPVTEFDASAEEAGQIAAVISAAATELAMFEHVTTD